MMNFSIVYGKDNNTDENDDSGCGLCSNNLGKNETGLEIQWEYSEYVYGALPSIFCLDCCIPNFPVEVLQACTRTRMRYNRHLDSYGMNFGIYGAEERVSEPDKLDSIRENMNMITGEERAKRKEAVNRRLMFIDIFAEIATSSDLPYIQNQMKKDRSPRVKRKFAEIIMAVST